MAQPQRKRTKEHTAPDVGKGHVIRRGTLGVAPTTNGAALMPAPAAPGPMRRLPPVRRPPRDFSPLTGRESEQREARELLHRDGRAEFLGETGIGKTSLLRYLGNRPEAIGHDQLVHVHWSSLDDVAQQLAGSFCVWTDDLLDKWPAPALTDAVRDVRALIEIDNLRASEAEIEQLEDWFPNCDLLLASEEPRPQAVTGVLVRGLDDDAGVEVIERYGAVEFTPDERTLARRISATVRGHPARLKSIGLSLGQAADRAHWLRRLMDASDAGASAAADVRGSLNGDEQRVYDVVAMLPNARLDPGLIRAIAGVADAAGVLAALERRGLVETSSPQYSVADLPRGWLKSPHLRVAFLRGLGAWMPDAGWNDGTIAEASLADLVPRVGALLEEDLDEVPWESVLGWVRTIDAALLLAGYWDAWELALAIGVVAAEHVHDASAIAWAWHQLGTRALCLGDLPGAERLLGDARRLREELDDREGVALCAQNIGFLDEEPVIVARQLPLLGPSGRFGLEAQRLEESLAAVSAEGVRDQLMIDRGYATAAHHFGDVLRQGHDLAHAEDAYRSADLLGHPRAAFELGLLLHGREDSDGARAAFARADERGDADGALALGTLRQHEGDVDAAADAYRRADVRGSAKAAIALGDLLWEQGEHDGAVAAFARADARGEVDGTFRLALRLSERGEHEAAEAAFRRADDRGHVAAAIIVGDLLRRSGDPVAAANAYRRAEERGDLDGAVRLGTLLQQHGHLDEAEAAYSRAVERGSVEAHKLLEVLLRRREAEASSSRGEVIGAKRDEEDERPEQQPYYYESE